MTTPKSTNQNSQQEAGHDHPQELAGNYGGGSLAGNEAAPGEAPRDSQNFSQPVHSLQSNQMDGERAERGAALQQGANAGDRNASGREPGRPDNVGEGSRFTGGTSAQAETDTQLARQAGAPTDEAGGPGWGNTGDAGGGAPLASRNAAPSNRIDQRAGQADDNPLLRTAGSQGSQQSARQSGQDDSLIRRGNGSGSQQGSFSGSRSGADYGRKR